MLRRSCLTRHLNRWMDKQMEVQGNLFIPPYFVCGGENIERNVLQKVIVLIREYSIVAMCIPLHRIFHKLHIQNTELYDYIYQQKQQTLIFSAILSSRYKANKSVLQITITHSLTYYLQDIKYHSQKAITIYQCID